MNTRVSHRDEYARSSYNFIITADLTSPNDELRNLGHACIVIGARRPARHIIDIQYDTKICFRYPKQLAIRYYTRYVFMKRTMPKYKNRCSVLLAPFQDGVQWASLSCILSTRCWPTFPDFLLTHLTDSPAKNYNKLKIFFSIQCFNNEMYKWEDIEKYSATLVTSECHLYSLYWHVTETVPFSRGFERKTCWNLTP